MKLSDLCFFVSEKTDVDTLNLHTYISTENMLPDKKGVTKASSLPTVSKVNAYMENDILVSNIRPYFKKIWKARFCGGCSNDVLVFRATPKCHSGFLYYVLSDDCFFNYVTGTSKGTKMPRGDKVAIMEYSVPDVSLSNQYKIASVLSSLDSKIEQNTAINNNLEQQIHAIFEHTFGDSSFDIQEKTTLGAVCNCVLGGTPSRAKAEFWNGDIPWINSGEVNKFRIIQPSEYITKIGLEKSATKLLPAHTTVIAITGATLGQMSLLEISSCANQSVVGILENEDMPYEFIYPFIHKNIGALLSHQTGGAQQHINKQNVEQLHLELPTKSVLHEYKNKVESFFKYISKNCFENERLEAIRDALLPKLMSGEIDVSKVDISDPSCLDKSLFNCVEG